MKRIVYSLFILLFVTSFLAKAAAPVWTITPTSSGSNIINITNAGTATVSYTVTNQSKLPHELAMTPIPGVTQVTTGGGCLWQSFYTAG